MYASPPRVSGTFKPGQDLDVSSDSVDSLSSEVFRYQVPPRSPQGAPCLLDCRLSLESVTSEVRGGALAGLRAVDGAKASGGIVEVKLVLYHCDPRLAGWPKERPLPEELWQPELPKLNAWLAKLRRVSEEVSFSNGRVKRVLTCSNTGGEPIAWGKLREFPFDLPSLAGKVDAVSNPETLLSRWTSAGSARLHIRVT